MRISLIAIVTSLISIVAFADTDLASLRWKNRVLVLLAAFDQDAQLNRQQAINAEALTGFSERDLSVVVETEAGGPLHRRFGIPGHEFQVVLIGKDGNTTLKWPQPVSAKELFSVIDAMPMRRDEMRRQQKN